MHRDRVIGLILALLSFTGCTHVVPLATPTITATTSLPLAIDHRATPTPTPTPHSPTPITAERLCTEDDFRTPPPLLDDPAALIGSRPPRGWTPGEEWPKTYGVVLLGSKYALQGYTLPDQHLILLTHKVCRYGEQGHYALAEIADLLWLSDIQANEIIIPYPDIALPFSNIITQRLEYTIEIFADTICEGTQGQVILRTAYDIDHLPATIRPGDQIPLQVVNAWTLDKASGTFRAIDQDGITCYLHFYGQ